MPEDPLQALLNSPRFSAFAKRYAPEYRYQPEEAPWFDGVGGTILDMGKAALSGVTGAVEDLGETATSIADWTIDGGLSLLLGRKVDLFEDNPDYHNTLTPDALVPQTKVGAAAREFMKFGVKVWALNIVGAGLTQTFPGALTVLGLSPTAAGALNPVNTLTPAATVAADGTAMTLAGQNLTGWQTVARGTTRGVITGAISDFTKHPLESLIDPDNPFINQPWYKEGLAGLLNSNPDDPQAVKRFRNLVGGILPNAAFSFIMSGLSYRWKLHKAKTAAQREANAADMKKDLDDIVAQQDRLRNNPEIDREEITERTIRDYATKSVGLEKPKRGEFKKFAGTRLNPETLTSPTNKTVKPLDTIVRAVEKGENIVLDDETVKRLSTEAARRKAEEMILTDPTIRGLITELGQEGQKGGLQLTTSILNLADVLQNEVTPNVVNAYLDLKDVVEAGADATAATGKLLDQLSDLVWAQTNLVNVKHYAGVALRSAGALSKNYKSGVDFSALASGESGRAGIKELLASRLTPKQIYDLGESFAVASHVYKDGRAVTWLSNMAKNLTTTSVPMTKWEMIKDFEKHYTYFSMLSGSRTHVGNWLGNTIKVFVTDPTDLYFSRLWSTRGDFGAAWADTSAYYGGLRKGFKTGLKVFRAAVKYGNSILAPDEGLKVDLTNPMLTGTNPSDAKWLKKVLDSPTDLLTGADEVFKQAAYRGNVELQIHDYLKTAQAQAILGENPSSATVKLFREALVDKFYGSTMVDNTSAVLNATAVRGFRDATGILDSDKAIQGALTSTWNNIPKNDAVFTILRTISRTPIGHHLMPFTKTVYNIGKDALADHNPLWNIRLMLDPAVRSNPEMMSKVVGHFATSVLMYGTMYGLYEAGLITGGGPSNKTARKIWQEAGNVPYSIKTPFGWVGIGNLDPIAAPLVMTADLWDRYSDIDPASGQERNSFIASAFNAISGYATNRTWLKSAFDIADALQANDITEFGSRFIRNNTASSWIPSALATTRQMIDPYTRETRDLEAPYVNRLPFWSDNVSTPRVSWLTGELVNSRFGDNWWERALSAASFQFKELRDQPDIVFANMVRSGVDRTPSRTLNGLSLNDSDYAQFCHIMGTIKLNGQTLYQTLEKQFKSKYWEKAYGIDPNEQTLAKPKEAWITKQVNRYKKAAEKEFFRQNQSAQAYNREQVRQKKLFRAGKIQSIDLEPYDSEKDYSSIMRY